MSRFFGPMTQLGFVVTDLEAAMDWWINSAKVGPWFFGNSALPWVVYKGVRSDGPQLSVGFANSGDMQIELIQQRCDTPTVYRDYLKAQGSKIPVGGGLHHFSTWPSPEEYIALKANAAGAGYYLEFEGGGPKGGFSYFSKNGNQDCFFEIAELNGRRTEFFSMVRDAAKGWDGRDPLRDREVRPL